MMKKKTKAAALGAFLFTAALFFSACGSSSADAYPTTNAAADTAFYSGAAYNEEAVMDFADASYDDVYEAAESTKGTSGMGSESAELTDSSRKLIKNVNLSVETEDYDVLLGNVTGRIAALGGYIEDSYSYNGSGYNRSGNQRKYGNLTIRIPATNLDEFLNNLAELSNITSKNYNVSDVTLQYVDTEARRDSLKTQHDRLLELMAEAETVEDIITIEARLSDLEYQLESAERQLRSYDNQVDYATVYMDISEVERYTPVEPKSRWQQMGEGFVESIYDAVDNVLDFLVGFVIALPHLILFAIFVLVIVLFIRGIVKHHKKKQAAKYASMQNAAPYGYAPAGIVTGASTEPVTAMGAGTAAPKNEDAVETAHLNNESTDLVNK